MLSLDLVSKIDLTILSPMMKQWYDIKMANPDCLILFRLGDFYELFFDDALEASRALEITLTHRDCGQIDKAPMCGVPYHSIDSYLAKLVNLNYKLAICEQMEDSNDNKGLVKRRLCKYITPGTFTELENLEQKNDNYILSLSYDDDNKSISLCTADVSTGLVKACYLKDDNIFLIINEVKKFSASEIILNKKYESFNDNIASPLSKLEYDLIKALYDNRSFLSFHQIENDFDCTDKLNFLSFENSKLSFINDEIKTLVSPAVNLMYSYLTKIQQNFPEYLTQVSVYYLSEFMQISSVTANSLEIFNNFKNNKKTDSLLSQLDLCKTAMGSRKLKHMLEHVLINKTEIDKRLNNVEYFLKNYSLRNDLRDELKNIFDIERLSCKLQDCSLNPRQLRSLAHSLSYIPQIVNLLQKDKNCPFQWKNIDKNLDILIEDTDLILTAVVENPPILVKDGGIISDDYHPQIKEYRSYAKHSKEMILNLEKEIRDKYKIKNLKISYNRIFGYYFEVNKSQINQVPPSFIRKQTLSNSERYINEDLKDLEDKVLSSQSKLLTLEQELFIDLRKKLSEHAYIYIQYAKELALLDVYLSFAQIAQDYNYVRPIIATDAILNIEDGRHPVIERKLKDTFIPNNLVIDGNTNKLIVITGPNMAGKSTYMRQIALICIMAQIGSFVPASKAYIGICDSIFTRIGASDDLNAGQSTFMVEMSEVSEIVHNLSERSLLILDEVGRGTSTYDGLSIAWALIEYLIKNKASSRTLFATHYHELTDLAKQYPAILNYHVAVKNDKNNIIFLHKIMHGACDDSYGIEVAKLAGLPHSLTKRAKQVLKQLEAKEDKNCKTFINQQDMFNIQGLQDKNNEVESEIINLLYGLEPDHLSPLQALTILSDVVTKLKSVD